VVGEGEHAAIVAGESRLADDGYQPAQVAAFGVQGIKLVGYRAMVQARVWSGPMPAFIRRDSEGSTSIGG
jgi:hypothetical protein